MMKKITLIATLFIVSIFSCVNKSTNETKNQQKNITPPINTAVQTNAADTNKIEQGTTQTAKEKEEQEEEKDKD